MILAYSRGVSGITVNELANNKNFLVMVNPIGTRRNFFKVVDSKRKYLLRKDWIQVISDSSNIVFRYGCLNQLPGCMTEVQDLNPMQLISNKFAFREWCMDKEFPTPETWRKDNPIENITYPIIGRPKYHSGGSGYRVIQSIEEYEDDDSYYYSTGISKKKEYRFFVFNNKVWFVALKRVDSDADPYEAWNYKQNNSVFIRILREKWKNNLVELCENLAQQLNILHVGIDLMLDQNNQPYLIEANNAPAITGDIKVELFSNILTKFEDHLLNNNSIDNFQTPVETE